MVPGLDDVTYGQDAPTERPSWSTTMSAAFRQDNMVGSFLANEMRDTPNFREEGFDRWKAIAGTKYEDHSESFHNIWNTRAADAMKRKIDREEQQHRELNAAPWYQSFVTQMIAGTLDLPTLLPGGAFVRGVSGGLSVARSALNVAAMSGLAAGIQESGLLATQETRTGTESAVAIGGSVLLGGLLGMGGAKLLSNVEWQTAVRALDKELGSGAAPVAGAIDPAIRPAPAAGGAQAVLPTTLEANSVAGRAASMIAKGTNKLNPNLRMLQSPSANWREIGTGLSENSIYLTKNFDGVASAPSVETLAKEWNGGLGAAVKMTNDAYPEYVKAGGKLDRVEFQQAVGRAMRRGDTDTDPHITRVANEWRSKVFDPLKKAAIDAKLLPPDVTVETAQSYFSRMWNRNRLVAGEAKFKGIVSQWIDDSLPKWADEFDRETNIKSAKLADEARTEYLVSRRIERSDRFEGDDFGKRVADEVFDTLTGRTGDEGVRPEFITVKARGPLKERTFLIPDDMVEEFLESDVDIVGRRYSRVMSADVEIARKFGRVDMADQIAKIREEYAGLRALAKTEKQRLALDVREKVDIGDLTHIRDQLRGVKNMSSAERNFDKVVRSANAFNYLTSMGEVVLASLTDAVRPAMVHGMSNYVKGIGQLISNLDAVKLSIKEGELAGNIAERLLGHRMATITEIIDPLSSRGPIEAFLENMTNVASKWNGIRIWTDWMKSVAFTMTQNRILENANSFATIKKGERAYMAYLGIDQSMAERIAKQFKAHGEVLEGVHVAHTQEWTDDVAVRTYRAAMNKDVDSIIVQRSVGDVPIFASTPTGKALLQFKSFALASHQKVLLRGLQEDQARFVGGMVAMTMIGMFITYMKAISGNRPEVQDKAMKNPGWWIGEGLDRSGVFAVPMELANIFEKMTGANPIKSPMKAWDQEGAISQKLQNRSLVGALAGPSAGLIDNIGTAAGIPGQMMRGEDLSKGQRGAAERLVPFNSYLGMRQMIRYLVNPPEP